MDNNTYILSNIESEIEGKNMKAKEAREKYLPKLYSLQRYLGKALTEEQKKAEQGGKKGITAYYYTVRIMDILNEVTEVIQALQTYDDDFEVDESEIEMKLRIIREEIAELPLVVSYDKNNV